MAQHPTRLDPVLRDGYSFQLGNYISKGFNLFSKQAGLFIGYLIVYFIISIGLSIIPFLGQLASFVIGGALTAGFLIVAEKIDTNQYPTFSNCFDGFKQLGQLFLATLLQLVILLLSAIPFLIYVFGKIDLGIMQDTSDPEAVLEMISGISGLLSFVLLLIPFIVSVFYTHTLPFILFDKMDAWAAMEASRKVVMKNLLPHILFFFVMGLIVLVSAIPLGLGLLATIPAAYCATYAAWADITNYTKEETADSDDIMRHLID